jgi:hypothetical protein
LRPETGRGANNWSVFEQCCRRGPVFLKNRPHVIENPAALNLGGGFRFSILIDNYLMIYVLFENYKIKLKQ